MSDEMSSFSRQGSSSSSSSLVFYAVEGRTCPVTCSVLGGSPPPNVELLVDGGRDLTASSALTRRLAVVPGAGLGVGFRRLVFSSERATVDYRPWPVEDGRTLQCVVSVPGLPPRVLSALLDVDCKHHRYLRSTDSLTAFNRIFCCLCAFLTDSIVYCIVFLFYGLYYVIYCHCYLVYRPQGCIKLDLT